jgi:hypothetical protein
MPLHQALRLASGRRAIVHAHSIRKVKVQLQSWEEVEDREVPARFFKVSDVENDAIIDSMAQLF